MRFLWRSLTGLFLMAVTVALLALAGDIGWRALQARWAAEPPGRGAQERVFSVNVTRVEPGRITPVLSVFGEVRSRRTLELRATSAGRVVWLSPKFEEGGQVAAGDLLVRIDPAEAEGALKRAEAGLMAAQAELRDAERAIGIAADDLKSTEAQAALREQALARQRDARGRGIATDTAVEEAELTAASARQQVLARRQSLAQANARLETARIGLEGQELAVEEAKRALANTEIHADFAGTLSGVTLVEGRLVSNNESLGQLIDPSALEVVFRLSAAEYARLLDGDGRLMPAKVAVSLEVAGIDLTASGAILRESGAVGSGQTGRQIFAGLDNPRGLRPGDFVSVTVEELPMEGVALLPAAALAADGTVLAVGEGDRLERVAVTLLRRQGDAVIVDALPVSGRDVVVEQTPLLGAGIKVRPMRPREAQVETVAEVLPEMVELSAERRARLIAYVEGNTRMPEDARRRVLAQLQEPQVPAQVVARIEARMGG